MVGAGIAVHIGAKKVISKNDLKATHLKTIPNSNLGERKNDVLRIHKENLRFIQRLANLKAHQDVLIPLDQQNYQRCQYELSLSLKYRSRSVISTVAPVANMGFKLIEGVSAIQGTL